MSMETIITQAEDAIIGAILAQAFRRNWVVSVNDDSWCQGEWIVQRSSNPERILKALRSTEGDTLRFRDVSGAKKGDVFLLYGNSGWDVIADHSLTLREVIDAIEPVIDEWEAKVSQADHTEV